MLKQIVSSPNGGIFTTELNTSHLFNFYYIKKRELKPAPWDGSGKCKWDICVEPKQKLTENSYFVLEHFTGTEAEVKQRLKDIICGPEDTTFEIGSPAFNNIVERVKKAYGNSVTFQVKVWRSAYEREQGISDIVADVAVMHDAIRIFADEIKANNCVEVQINTDEDVIPICIGGLDADVKKPAWLCLNSI